MSLMSLNKLFVLVFVSLLKNILGVELTELEILGIEPNGGPIYGETRVTVRLKDFNTDLIDEYDRPKVMVFIYFSFSVVLEVTQKLSMPHTLLVLLILEASVLLSQKEKKKMKLVLFANFLLLMKLILFLLLFLY